MCFLSDHDPQPVLSLQNDRLEMELQTTNYCWTGGLWAVLVVNTEDVFSKGIVRNDETKPEGLSAGTREGRVDNAGKN